MHDTHVPFVVNPSAGVPIYRQIIDQVEALVAGGQLRSGTFLPSVRDVARALDINPMTVSKAYSRLEASGVIERVRGKGMRVTERFVDEPLDRRREALRCHLEHALRLAHQLGLSESQVVGVVRSMFRELKP